MTARRFMYVLALIAVAVAATMARTAYSTPTPGTGSYHRLYFCAYPDGHVLYAENSRQLDCPGHPEVLVLLGTEIDNH